MKIYVASSWRNKHFDEVVATLRQDGHEVYDFKTDGDAFAWPQIDPEWRNWTPTEFLSALDHPLSHVGFKRDMDALRWADACVMVHPCGSSASLEAGWACGAGKLVLVYVPDLREAELMLKMADLVTNDLDEIRRTLVTH